MKALVLAGGTGTRLRPFTHTLAKQLMPVANKPVLFHCLESIADAGITSTGIIVGGRGDDLRRAVGDGSRFGLEVTWIEQREPLGLAHCVMIAADFLGDDDFVMYLGDNIVSGGIGQPVKEFAAGRPDVLLMVGPVDDPTAFGIAEVGADGRVLGLAEKPAVPSGDLALIGVYVFSAAIHRAVRSIVPSPRGELEITDAVGWLVEHGADVRAHVFSGYWKDTGQVDDLLDCNRELLRTLEPVNLGTVDVGSELVGAVSVAAGARVTGSRVTGPVVIGRDTVVTDSRIGPYCSIGDGCVVSGAEIADSIVLDGASVRDVRAIERSVAGRHSRIGGVPAGDSARRLLLGDGSEALIEP
ncbi:glucose-1-phosphate thymidylyltransferase [Actinomadura algeriensis]|uniref:Glucose-1-phosphate thymidylyltransferase n=1 Tax=Actinomadura algeriensis TaxID=1679523 RepID=A0ABR9JIX3_9ACTN|nr:glucose-1-phosphate thymidylyltransferase [Actinomadura algeriensis]MBE1530501.1 glucose-1-phosphate thymidylyltransferase [Actinomadura algeriensis]